MQIGALFLIMGSFVMGFIPVTCDANKALQYIFNFLPSYALGKGLTNVRRAVNAPYLAPLPCRGRSPRPVSCV
jgi:hypothetical protein